MERPTGELTLDLAERLAGLARRMTVLQAAAHAAGHLHTPPPNLPDRLAEHVRFYTGVFRKAPTMGPIAQAVLERYAEAGRDLALLEAEADGADELVVRVREHVRYLDRLPTLFAGCDPLQQLFQPKAPGAPAAPAAPQPRPATGRLMPTGRPPTGPRPAFPENQALLDRGLAQLRALDAKVMVLRAGCAMAANPALPPSLTLPAQARETAKRVASLAAADPATLAALKQLVDHYAHTKKLFDQRPMQQPDAARAALDRLGELAAGLAAYPAVAKLLEAR